MFIILGMFIHTPRTSPFRVSKCLGFYVFRNGCDDVLMFGSSRCVQHSNLIE